MRKRFGDEDTLENGQKGRKVTAALGFTLLQIGWHELRFF
jgi:hypothetical protein